MKPLVSTVRDQISDEVVKLLVGSCFAGLGFGATWFYKFIRDTRAKEEELARSISHIKRTLDQQSHLLAEIDRKLDRSDDKDAEFDKRLSIIEIFTKHGNSGFHRLQQSQDE